MSFPGYYHIFDFLLKARLIRKISTPSLPHERLSHSLLNSLKSGVHQEHHWNCSKEVSESESHSVVSNSL